MIILADGTRVVLRARRAEDDSYVIPSWVASSLSRLPARVRAEARRSRTPIVQRIASASRVDVACSPHDERTIVGWLATRGDVVEWCYVPLDMRQGGIATALLTHRFGTYPERVVCAQPWPFDSGRFVHRAKVSAA